MFHGWGEIHYHSGMSAFAKEFLRTITRKPGRFLALLAIVALGAGFYAGLRMTSPDMNLALDR